MATNSSLNAEDRRSRILATLASDGAVKLDDIAAFLDVSPMTVRRDFDELETEGLLRRVRGGAVAATGPRPFSERRTVRQRAKQTIAAKAMAFIPTSGAIAIDASSTTGTIIGELDGKEDLIIATNSYDNFLAARTKHTRSPILVGGEAEPETGSFVGMIAHEAASSMLYRRFFASATALDAELGASEVSLAESHVKHAFAQRAEELILCIDSSKLGERSVAASFDVADIDVLITELDPADARLDAFRGKTELR